MRQFGSIIHPAGDPWSHVMYVFPGWTVHGNLWRLRTRPWTKLTQTQVRAPMKDPSSGPISTRVSGYDPATYVHVEWGNTRFKNLGQPSYIGLPVPFSRHANQYVEYLIKIKYAIDPYLFGSEGRIKTPFLLCTQRLPYLFCISFDWMEWTLK